MSSHNIRVMSLDDKVGVICKYEQLNSAYDRKQFLKVNNEHAKIIANKAKIFNQYDAMQAKLAAVRDLVISEYGKPNYIAEKHAFLEKVIIEWYKRAVAFLGVKTVSVALVYYKTDFAKRVLNITGLPLSETYMTVLKINCHEASRQGTSTFESTTLSIRELLVKLNISKDMALSMYGPNIFEEEPEDDVDPTVLTSVRFLWRNKSEKRKFEQYNVQKQRDYKSPRTSNERHVSCLGNEDEGIELKQCDGVNIQRESKDADGGATYTKVCLLPCEPKVEDDSPDEQEDFQLYDVISVVDSTDDFDAVTSTKNSVPDSLVKKECQTSKGSEKEAIIPQSAFNPCTIIKVEPDSSQSEEGCTTDSIVITKVRKRVEDWLIKNECATTDDDGVHQPASIMLEPGCSIKIESEALEDGMSTTTYFEDYATQKTEEENSDQKPNLDSDEEGSIEIFAVISEDGSNDFNAATATSSMDTKCVDNGEHAMQRLGLTKRYLQLQQNVHASEALPKVEAALPNSGKNSS